MGKERLAISNKEIIEMENDNIKWCRLSDFYITRLIRKANEFGLKGQKIKEVIGITNIDSANCKYIDFILEDKK